MWKKETRGQRNLFLIFEHEKTTNWIAGLLRVVGTFTNSTSIVIQFIASTKQINKHRFVRWPSMMSGERKEEIEPAVVPVDLHPSLPSKAASIVSDEPETEKKYETIQTIKMNDPNHATTKSMEKPMSVMNSSLNLLPTQEIPRAPNRKGVSVNTKLGIIQLVLSIMLSAFGGLLIARNASLSMLGKRSNSFVLTPPWFSYQFRLRNLERNFRWNCWCVRLNEHQAIAQRIFGVQFNFCCDEHARTGFNGHWTGSRLQHLATRSGEWRSRKIIIYGDLCVALWTTSYTF